MHKSCDDDDDALSQLLVRNVKSLENDALRAESCEVMLASQEFIGGSCGS